MVLPHSTVFGAAGSLGELIFVVQDCTVFEYTSYWKAGCYLRRSLIYEAVLGSHVLGVKGGSHALYYPHPHTHVLSRTRKPTDIDTIESLLLVVPVPWWKPLMVDAWAPFALATVFLRAHVGLSRTMSAVCRASVLQLGANPVMLEQLLMQVFVPDTTQVSGERVCQLRCYHL